MLWAASKGVGPVKPRFYKHFPPLTRAKSAIFLIYRLSHSNRRGSDFSMHALAKIRQDLSLTIRPVFGFMVLGIFWGSYAALAPQIKAQIGAGDGLFGTLLLMSALGLVTAMWLAPRVDRHLGKWGLPLGAGLLALSFAVLGAASRPLEFGIGMILAGAASGLTDVIINARVSEAEAAYKRPLMSLNHAMFSFAYALAALSAGAAREFDASALQVFVGLGVIVALALPILRSPSFLVGASQDGATEQGVDLARFWSGLVIWPGLVVMFGFMSEAAMESWSALHIERSLGGRAVEGAIGPFMLGLTMGIGRLAGHFLTQAHDTLRMVSRAALVSAAGAVIAAFAVTPEMAYTGFAIQGLGVSIIAPLALGLAGQLAGSGERTRTIARVSVIGFAGFLLAPATMGWMAELASLRVAFGMIAVILLIIPLICARALRPLAPARGGQEGRISGV